MGDQLGYVVEGCFIPLVATFGILGNLASICVLRDNRLEMKATFRYIQYRDGCIYIDIIFECFGSPL